MSAFPTIKGNIYSEYRKSVDPYKKRLSTEPKADSLQTFQHELETLMQKRKSNRINQQTKSKVLQLSRSKDLQMFKLEMEDVKKRLALQQKTRLLQNKFHDIKDQLVLKTIKATQQHQKQISPRMYNSVTYPDQMPPQYPIHPLIPYSPLHFSPYQSPLYYSPYQSPHHNSSQHRHHYQLQDSRYNDPQDTKTKFNYQRKNKHQRKFDRVLRKKQNKRKLKKYFYSVCFMIFLKNLSQRIMKKRRQIFDKFWPKMFQQQTLTLKKWFAQGSKKFFILMLKKEDTDLTVYEDDYKEVKVEKINSLKMLIKTLIKGFQSTLSHQYFDRMIQILHIFCKHGAYIDNGVLTREEIQSVCISKTYGYIRADHSLQKSNIINFIFLKIIVFNIILQPWKLDSVNFSQQKKTLKNNFYFIGSILYRIILTLRETYLSHSTKNNIYKIGNWQQTGLNFKCSYPLVYPKTKYEQGQFISGLVDETHLLKIFQKDIWKAQRQGFRSLVEKIHENLVQYHKNLIVEKVQYKKPFDPEYKPFI